MPKTALRPEHWLVVVDRVCTTAKHGLTCLTVIAAFYFANESLANLAGKTTLADIFIGLLVSSRVGERIAWIAAILAGAYGYRERRLRGKKVSYLTARIVELENKADPGRSSSNLTATGGTRPEDR